MESAALSGLTSLVTSNATNGWFQGFPNDGQKMMLHIAILSLVCLFCCSVSASRLHSNVNYEAGARCFQGLITVFSAITVAMLSACILPWYFKLFSCLFCSIPVIVHTISDTRWVRDWFPDHLPVLPLYHQFRNSLNRFPGTNKRSNIVSHPEANHTINIPSVSHMEPNNTINIPTT